MKYAVDEQFIADVGGRKFAMLADVESMSGYRLYEIVTPDEEQPVKRNDPLYVRAYAAARKLMP